MKKMKKALVIALALCMALSAIPGMALFAGAVEEADGIAAPIAAAPAFNDVKAGEWYCEGIDYCVEKGLMNGTSDTTFEPEGTATRAMIVTVLWRIEGEPVVNYAMNFADVEEDQWYTEAIRWAASEQIVNGYGDTFGVDDFITRQDFATILYRYAQKIGFDTDKVMENTNTLSFEDVFTVADYASGAMNFAVAAGIVKGDNGYLKPADDATRAEVATMFMRFEKCIAGPGAGLAGGWTENTEFGEAEIPEAAQAAFDKAFKGFAGVGYEPVAYLGSQVVAGTNYKFLCTYTTVTAEPETGFAVVTVYADLAGEASVLDVTRFTIPDVMTEELTFPESGLAGGWNCEEASEAVLSEEDGVIVENALAGFAGVGYTPIAKLGTQVVAGKNTAFLCKANRVTADPVSTLAVVVVYTDLEGTSTILNTYAFEIKAEEDNSVEYESLEALNEAVGGRLCRPAVMGVSDETFALITDGETEIAEYDFTLNGNAYVFRFSPAFTADIADLEYDGVKVFDLEDTSVTEEIFCCGEFKAARWIDVNGQYVFILNGGEEMEDETFKAIVDELKNGTLPGMTAEEKAAIYAGLIGQYQDSFSGRAVMEVTAADEGVNIVVHWSDSASAYAEWTMTGIIGEDGVLGYTDCTEKFIQTGADGETESTEILYENGEGFFSINEGALLWLGAADENCQQCVFEKPLEK